jgi:exopolysaccharide biosynthesis polyprenyl glycosylphosphotransferase
VNITGSGVHFTQYDMRRLDIITAAISVPLDFAMVLLAALAAYSLRFSGSIAALRPAIAELPFRSFLGLSVGIAFLWVLCMAIAGLYQFRRRQAIAEVGRIVLASSAAVTTIILTIFFRRELFSSRFIVLAGWLLGILFITTARLLVRVIVGMLKRKGIGLQKLVVIGAGSTADQIVSDLYAGRREGYVLVGRIPEFSADGQGQLRALLTEQHPDAVLLASASLPQADLLALLTMSEQQHFDFAYVADLFATHAGHLEVRTMFGQPVVEVKRTKLDGWGRIWKRSFDIVVAFVLLLILLPFFTIFGLLIVLDSRGPVFVRLVRIGERERQFTLVKFRSMIQNAHALKPTLMDKNERGDGPLFKMAHDPRITRVGRFLRRTSIDELPQLWNVLRGQMSLVGPRPHEPEEVARYQPWHRKLLTIKPGMTGMAQVSGRASLSFDDEARLDIAYLENWSFATDLMILLRTPRVVFTHRAAV